MREPAPQVYVALTTVVTYAQTQSFGDANAHIFLGATIAARDPKAAHRAVSFPETNRAGDATLQASR